jgi:hypothetical protein
MHTIFAGGAKRRLLFYIAKQKKREASFSFLSFIARAAPRRATSAVATARIR